MKILKNLKQKAKQIKATIIMVEANIDERVYEACKIILKQKLANLIVFGKEEEFDACFKTPACQIIDIETYPKHDLAKLLFELRQNKGMTMQKANALLKQPIYFGMMLLKSGIGDGLVAGAVYKTADVLLPALQIIKTKQGEQLVTGSVLLVKPNCEPLLFGDVSLMENPSSEQLALIAQSNAKFMQNVVGIEPKVAMLSYSTKGSAKSEIVEKVQTATKLAQRLNFGLVDGEMQIDSALDFTTAKQKGITSAVGGHANVLIFPNLDAGNIGYKLTARLANYQAVGPIMLNFAKPVNDLSRGSNIEEIVNTIIITKLLTTY